MNKNTIKITLLILSINTFYSLHGMFAQIGRRTVPANRTTGPMPTTIQKRSLYTMPRLEGIHESLTKKAKELSPVLGAAGWHSGRLPRMYAISTDKSDPIMMLIHELFHQLQSDFRPTHSLSKAAFALTPGIIGLILGALVSIRLSDQNEREYIIDEWRHEYARLTGEKKQFSKTKISNLLNLIQTAYNSNKNETCSVLISFLYAKSDPENEHDMIHYLLGLNHYIDIFIRKKGHITQKFQQAVRVKEKTIFEKLQLLIAWLKKSLQTSYTPEEYASALQALAQNPTKKTAIDNFGPIIGAIINEKQKGSPYPPRTIMSEYGYKAQRKMADCFEAAFQSLLNVLLYHQPSQTFDLSLLPTTIQVNEKLKNFYTEFQDTTTINSRTRGQVFMDLVSGLPKAVDIAYVEKNYEIDTGIHTEKNFLHLFNYFFNLDAHNFQELGTMLSDTRRTIRFTTAESNDRGDGAIIMTITTIATESQPNPEERKAHFGFNLEHAWLEKPQQIGKENLLVLIENTDIVGDYQLNPHVKAIFDLQPNIQTIKDVPNVSTSMYYSFPTDLPSQKRQIILELLDKEIIDKPALDYAYSLYTQLADEDKMDPIVSGKLIEEIIKSDYWISFKEFLANNLETTLEEATSLAKDDPKYNDRLKKWLKYKETKDYKDLEETPFTATKERLATE